MGINVEEYIDVEERARFLGCNMPTGVCILPRNFEIAGSKDELFHESCVATIRTLWREKDIVETRLEKEGEKFPYIQEDAFDWVAPVIFIGVQAWHNNQEVLGVILKVFSDYLKEWFKGLPKSLSAKKVKFEIVKEETHRGKGSVYKKLTYDGSVDGLSDFRRVVEKTWNG